MDRKIIEKDGKWRNDHGIDAKWTIFDGKGFFVDTCYDAYLKGKKIKCLWSFLEAFFFSTLCNIFFKIRISIVKKD